MSICISAQMCSYVRTLFEHPSKWYESYQENGTKYLKSRKKLDEELQQQLNACAGEIFICGIPADTRAEKIAEVASLLGEVYILRFKVHFSGASRGFAYLQYIDPNLISLALEKLPLLFRLLHLPMIKVCTSRNRSKLLLRKTNNMTPLMVFETLTKLVNFNKLVGHELFPGYFEYQIIFKCNEEAVHARREILKSIIKFGPKAVILWDAVSSNRNNDKIKLKMLGDRLNKQNVIPSPHHGKTYEMISSSIPNVSHDIYKNLQQQNITTNDNLTNYFTNMKLF